MTQDDVVGIVRICAAQFRFYEGQHAAKGTPEADEKAKVNREFAEMCEGALARLSSPPEAAAVRPEVAAFALLMEQELRANDHKPGWKNDDIVALADRVLEEARELHDCASGYRCSRSYDDAFAGTSTDAAFQERLCRIRRNLASEAADVANMAMMVADVAGALDAALSAGPAGEVGEVVGEGFGWSSDRHVDVATEMCRDPRWAALPSDVAALVERLRAWPGIETDALSAGVVSAMMTAAADAIGTLLAALKAQEEENTALHDHIAEQIQHVEQRIEDGKQRGATIWRLALEDVARENRATIEGKPA